MPQVARHHLPSHSELVREPAASAFFATVSTQSVLVVIDCGLVLTDHDERDIEGVLAISIERRKVCPEKVECNRDRLAVRCLHLAGLPAARKDREVERYGFFGVAVNQRKGVRVDRAALSITRISFYRLCL